MLNVKNKTEKKTKGIYLKVNASQKERIKSLAETKGKTITDLFFDAVGLHKKKV